MAHIPNILSIAGSDSGGGAGIQADIKTIMALGGYGLTVITALTAQNGSGVAGIEAPAPEFVVLQLTTVLDGFSIAAAKTGMLYSAGIIKAVAPILSARKYPLVVDPVSVSQSGSKLLEEEAVEALKDCIIPDCDLVTPNVPEAAMLTGIPVSGMESAVAAGEKLLDMGAKAVLVKGGHMGLPHPHADIMVTDYLIRRDAEPKALQQARVDTQNNHGTGCTLSSAIACELGKGTPLEIAVVRAQRYLNTALRRSYTPGKGAGPVNHDVRI